MTAARRTLDPTPISAARVSRRQCLGLAANDAPELLDARLDPRQGHSDALAELPGYVLWDNAQLLRVIEAREAGMTVKIPGNAGRDLVELRMATVNGQEELHSGSLVY